MTQPDIEAMVRDLGAFPGVDGCALVEAESGMVWFHGGDFPAIEQIGEAAIEFWRIQTRLSKNFKAMGPLRSAAYSFSTRVVALFPCADNPPLVLVCVAHKTNVAWGDWAKHTARLKDALAASAFET